ncbi:hypothetical protein BJV77DRAFT_972451 [Russula vinacea]|nr:hypothetical protein BJV77DRAFT_972451 [Russula vinacea]
MADLVRLAKSGDSWNINELEAFNISIVEQEQETPCRFSAKRNCVEELDASSLALMKRLDIVMTITEDEKESAVNDFAAELLRVMGYEARSTIVRRRKRMRLLMCGEQVYAETDVCDKSSHTGIKPPQDPEPQLSNNAKRVNDLYWIHCRRWSFREYNVGTFPRFYKIKVTADLDHCVRHGLYPTTRTSHIGFIQHNGLDDDD